MTSTGSRRVGNPHPGLARRLVRNRKVSGRAQAQQMTVETFQAVAEHG